VERTTKGAMRDTVEDAFRGSAELWSAFEAPETPARFLATWLALLCRQAPGARTGLLLLQREDGAFAPAALWPEGARDVTALGPAAERALTQSRPVVEGAADGVTRLACPIALEGAAGGVVALECDALAEADLPGLLRRILWASGWIGASLARAGGIGGEERAARGAAALQSLAALLDENALDGARMAFVNELAERLGLDRVSLGRRKGSRVRLVAVSSSAWIDRRTEPMRRLETAMAEAAMQDDRVATPPEQGRRPRIDVAHKRLAGEGSARAVASLPVRDRGRTIAVLTCERAGAEPFDAATMETLDLVAALAGPILTLKESRHRWVSGRLVDGVTGFVHRLVGPRRPGLKLATAGALVALAIMATLPGDFRVVGRATLEGAVQRAAVAPFAGYVARAVARAGDRVEEGQPLAELDDRDLRLERLKAESERQKAAQRQREALARSDRAALAVTAAQIAQIDAEIGLVDARLARARIVAPLTGLVVSGDYSQLLGAPVEQGKVMFEVAPLDDFRVVIQTLDADMRHVAVGQRGQVAFAGFAEAPLPIVVTAVTSVASAQDGRTVFRVEARLQGVSPALRPGLEGVARLEIGRAPLLWIWTRATLDRARLTLWRWLP
jgi:multidrug efflux pump subunit AcrA (membrane-fusion protein)